MIGCCLLRLPVPFLSTCYRSRLKSTYILLSRLARPPLCKSNDRRDCYSSTRPTSTSLRVIGQEGKAVHSVLVHPDTRKRDTRVGRVCCHSSLSPDLLLCYRKTWFIIASKRPHSDLPSDRTEARWALASSPPSPPVQLDTYKNGRPNDGTDAWQYGCTVPRRHGGHDGSFARYDGGPLRTEPECHEYGIDRHGWRVGRVEADGVVTEYDAGKVCRS